MPVTITQKSRIYSAATQEQAAMALDAFAKKWDAFILL